jgi:hypothetical protein
LHQVGDLFDLYDDGRTYKPQTRMTCFLFVWNVIICFVLIIKPTGCTNFSNLFLEWNSTCFGEFLCPSSGVFTVHTAMVYIIKPGLQLASRIRMELSFIPRINLRNSASSWFYYKKLTRYKVTWTSKCNYMHTYISYNKFRHGRQK